MAADGYVDSISASLAPQLVNDSVSKLSLQDAAPDFHTDFAPQPARYGLEYDRTSSSSGINAQLHIVMVPYPVQGQINPMMQFAKLLTTRRNDVMVTLVNNKDNHDRILCTQDSNYGPNLQFAWVDTGLPSHITRSVHFTRSDIKMIRESNARMKEPLTQLLQSLNRKSTPAVSCVLFGTLCTWGQLAAAELNIPNFMFWTQSAFVFSIYYHLPLLVANNFFPYDKKRLSGTSAKEDEESVEPTSSRLVTYIPGVPPLHPSSFPSLLHVDDISDPSLTSTREQFSLMGGCSGVLVNSFHELEKDTWQALQQELPYPLWSVGPLLLAAGVATAKSTGAGLLQETNDCITWLDSKQKQSVLYISFGSLFKPSTAELEGIALGIKASKQPYLWVIRPSASSQDVSEVLPAGFVEETRDYGLIIPWAPQVQVLSHPAVGAFLTHCGWNSILESLSMGMPMISYPIFMEQPTNAAFVCDVWKVGMALKRQDDGKVKSEHVEKVLKAVLQDDEGVKMRERAMKLRDAARQAVQVQGSSHAHLEEFIQALAKKL